MYKCRFMDIIFSFQRELQVFWTRDFPASDLVKLDGYSEGTGILRGIYRELP